jgi:hypothetical protein
MCAMVLDPAAVIAVIGELREEIVRVNRSLIEQMARNIEMHTSVRDVILTLESRISKLEGREPASEDLTAPVAPERLH